MTANTRSTIVHTRLLAAALVALAWPMAAQQQVTLTAVPPPAVGNLRAAVVGTPGNQTFCYWVAANYVGGTVVSANPTCVMNAPTVLNSTNRVQITWSAVAVDPPGTVNYTILRVVNSATRPTPGASIVVRTLGATTGNDIGNALTVWSPFNFPYQTASETIRLNNRDYTSPVVELKPWPLALGPPNGELAYSANVTVAQVNAGVTIVAPVSNRTLRVTHFLLQALGGATAGCTSVRISDTSTGPIDVVTVLVAALTQNTVVTEATASNVTLGTFATSQLTPGAGLQVRKVGSSCTTATSFNVSVFYQINF